MKSRLPFASLFLVFLVASMGTSPCLAQFQLERHDGGVRVLQEGKLIADYLTKSNSRPIVWPLLGPDGVKMTRDYPMVPESVGEAHDHPHHRSFWFTHGEVNGVDFWAETPNHGTVEHQAFTVLSEGEHAIVAANNIWKKPDGTPVLTERRRLTFGGTADVRWMDCEFVLAAEHGEVHFGDTKEGSFALRVAESMKVDAKLGGKILNSRGDENQKAWGQPAEWVDYVGPIDDATYGIAIFCHPTTFHYPNRWHVRTYGLFAANPFGVYHFTGDKEPTAGVVLESGEELTFRYRILLHRGDTESAEIAEHFAKFAQQEFEKL